MKRWESAGSEYMSYIKTFISDQIYDHLYYLNYASDDDYDKNRVHVKPVGKELVESVDCVLYHEKYWLELKLFDRQSIIRLDARTILVI